MLGAVAADAREAMRLSCRLGGRVKNCKTAEQRKELEIVWH